jgi:hypothetical protein
LPSLSFVIIEKIVKKLSGLSLLALCVLLFSACGAPPLPAQTEVPVAPSAANDPCSAENLPTTIQGINDLMREFDDASQLASNLPAPQVPDVITSLQRIRRQAEDVQIPGCLSVLKTHQLNHMNLTIQTLIAFVGGASQETLKNGLEMARREHDLYSLEIVRLLGITLAPVTTTPSSTP